MQGIDALMPSSEKTWEKFNSDDESKHQWRLAQCRIPLRKHFIDYFPIDASEKGC